MKGHYKEITWRDFVTTYLARNKVSKLEVVNGKWVRVNLMDGSGENTVPYFSIGSVDTFERNLENAQMEIGLDSANSVPVFYKQEIEMSNVVSALPTLLLVAFLFWSFRRASGAMGGMSRGKILSLIWFKDYCPKFDILGGGGRPGGGGGMFGMGNVANTTAKLVNANEINVAFKDVAGCEEAKIEIMEFVNFLKNPQQYIELGAKIPKGKKEKSCEKPGRPVLPALLNNRGRHDIFTCLKKYSKLLF